MLWKASSVYDAGTISFDMADTFQAAWEYLWDKNQKLLKKWDRSYYHYVSATDLVRRFRASLVERIDKRPYGSLDCDGYGVRVHLNGKGMTLLGWARDWLYCQVRAGKLEAYNPKGSTCSGLRFRPVGASYSAAEIELRSLSKEDRSRRYRIYHAKDVEGGALCGVKNRSMGGRHPFRKRIAIVGEDGKVTCKRCLRAMEMRKFLNS